MVISKRKQTAVERRTGRELLRDHDRLYPDAKSNKTCALNTTNTCERCIDCMIYGYAAGGGGAQKSRVITDDAFSLHDAAQIVSTRTFNAPFDDSTPYDAETGKRMTGLGEDEYVRPQAVFLDMETLKDLTADEFRYVLGNVLRSSRYGAIASRLGKVDNRLLAVIFSDTELFSNLELVQATYDRLAAEGTLAFPLPKQEVHEAMQAAIPQLLERVVGQVTVMPATEVGALQKEMGNLYGDDDAIHPLLVAVGEGYGPQ